MKNRNEDILILQQWMLKDWETVIFVYLFSKAIHIEKKTRENFSNLRFCK